MANEIATLIQRTVPIGSEVTITTGTVSYHGILAELSLYHVRIEQGGSVQVILVEAITGFALANDDNGLSGPSATSDPAGAPPITEVPARQSESAPAPVSTRSQPDEMFERRVKHYQGIIEATSLELPPVALSDKALLSPGPPDDWEPEATIRWDRCTNSFSYARKVNELDPKFGRVARIARDVFTLTRWYPENAMVQRLYGHLLWLAGQTEPAIEYLARAANFSNEENDRTALFAAVVRSNSTDLLGPAAAALFRPGEYELPSPNWDYFVRFCTGNGQLGLLLGVGEAIRRSDDLRQAMEARAALYAAALATSNIDLATDVAEAPSDVTPERLSRASSAIPSMPDDLVRPQSRIPVTPNNRRPGRRSSSSSDGREPNGEQRTITKALRLREQGDHERAIELLEAIRPAAKDKTKIDNILLNSYQPTGRYADAARVLTNKLQIAPESKRSALLSQLLSAYVNDQKWSEAQDAAEQLLQLEKHDRQALRTLAIAFHQKGEQEESDRVFQLLIEQGDPKAEEIRSKIGRTGASEWLDLEAFLLSATPRTAETSESELTEFLLSRCAFEGVPPDRLQAGPDELTRFDADKVAERARDLGTRLPGDRGSFLVSAAKIENQIRQKQDPSDVRFYRYMYRGCISLADAAIFDDSRSDESARELYAEGLALYDLVRRSNRKGEEQDALNGIYRYLLSSLNQRFGSADYGSVANISEVIHVTAVDPKSSSRVLESLVDLTSRSDFARRTALRAVLDTRHGPQAVVDFAQRLTGTTQAVPNRLPDVLEIWSIIERHRDTAEQELRMDLATISQRDLRAGRIQEMIQEIDRIREACYLRIDRDYLRRLVEVYLVFADVAREQRFEERERLYDQVQLRAAQLTDLIELSPTRIAVSHILPLIGSAMDLATEQLRDLYRSAVPSVDIAMVGDRYVPSDSGNIRVKISISNSIGRAPVESLELEVLPDGAYVAEEPVVQLPGALRGGERVEIVVALRLNSETIESKTFALPVALRYSSRTSEKQLEKSLPLAVRLDDPGSFVQLKNPYAKYAGGGPVDDPAMFFGRDDQVSAISDVVAGSGSGRSVLVFGQRRAGKSSVLHHLKNRLIRSQDVFPIDVGNLGAMLDDQSDIPLLNQLLFKICRSIRSAALNVGVLASQAELADTISRGDGLLDHSAPLVEFTDIMDSYRRCALAPGTPSFLRTPVLLIDEFTYLFDWIKQGKLPTDFMKSWKALLQQGGFSAVLVGTEEMQEFKNEFPNEFGTTKDFKVSYLADVHARELVVDPVKEVNGIDIYSDNAPVTRIVELTGGSAYYLQLFCDRLVNYMNRERVSVVSIADVEIVKGQMINGAESLGEDNFHSLFSAGEGPGDRVPREDAIRALSTIAIASDRGREISKAALEEDLGLIGPRTVESLLAREVIEVREQSVRIRVRLLEEWLNR